MTTLLQRAFTQLQHLTDRQQNEMAEKILEMCDDLKRDEAFEKSRQQQPPVKKSKKP